MYDKHAHHRLTYEFVKSKFDERGCALITTEYKNNQQLLDYICKCGKPHKMRFMNFKKGRNCKNCAIISTSGPNNYLYRHDKEAQRKEHLFRKRNYDYLSRVKNRTNKRNDEYDLKQLGYTHDDLMNHLKTFPNWDIVSKGEWVIDHKYPISAFVKYGIYDLKLINCLDNLQPLSDKENSSKNRYHDHTAFIAWLATKGITVKENQNETL